MRVTLYEMIDPQQSTPIQVNNSCADGILNNEIKQNWSKAMDMRFHWIRDRINQGHYIVYWRPGYTNKTDYYTTRHPPSDQSYVRYNSLQKSNAIIDQINNIVSL